MTPLDTTQTNTEAAVQEAQVATPSAATSVSQIPSHDRWLPVARDQAEKRFWYEPLLESGVVPDAVIRAAIRRMLRDRLREEDHGSEEANRAKLLAFVDEMKRSPIALRTDSANAQHYEVPAAFFQAVLGPRLKYSSAFFPDDCDSLAAAEEAMLRLTCERAELADGQNILELGCGWGSLTLWMAEHFPASRITAVSNSASQRAFIESQAAQRGFRNVRIVTADMNEFDPSSLDGFRGFDRVVSVEMFEHMRNWDALLERVSTMARAGRKNVHAHFYACAICVSLRGARRRRLDGAAFFHRRHDAERRFARPLRSQSQNRAALASEWHALREDVGSVARQHGCESRKLYCRCSPQPTARATRRNGGRAGAFSSWPAPSSGTIATAKSGSSRTTC